MRALLLAALLVSLTAVAIAPTGEARPPGGGCQVQEEYVTEASLGKDENGMPTVNPGARRPIECYY